MMIVQAKQRITSGFVQGWQDVVLPHLQQIIQLQPAYRQAGSGLDRTLIGFICYLVHQ
jgi:hypothetical protein